MHTVIFPINSSDARIITTALTTACDLLDLHNISEDGELATACSLQTTLDLMHRHPNGGDITMPTAQFMFLYGFLLEEPGLTNLTDQMEAEQLPYTNVVHTTRHM